MPVSIKEWTQREWTHPKRMHFAEKGDFWDLYGLMPHLDHPKLIRSPAWSAQVDLPGTFTDCEAILYDRDVPRTVFIGRNGSGNLASARAGVNWSMSGPDQLVSGRTLGGLHGRNALLVEGHIFLIADNGDVYEGTSVTGTLSSFDSSTNHQALCYLYDRVYTTNTTGNVYRVNSGITALEFHYNDAIGLDILFMMGFRDDLYAFAKGEDGRGYILRIDNADAVTVRQYTVAELHHYGTEQSLGYPFAQIGNQVYLSPGVQTNPAGVLEIPIYAFTVTDAASLHHVVTVPLDDTDDVISLVAWRGRLFLARLIADGADSAHMFKQVFSTGATDAIPCTADAQNSLTPACAAAGPNLVVTTDDGDEGVVYAGPSTGLQDGYLITSRLDMGYPGREKRLNRITVLLDDAATDFKCVIKYRTDDTTDWTTLTTANNTHRASADLTTPTTFYLLQLRIELDDDSGNDEDIGIEAVSVTYSIDT